MCPVKEMSAELSSPSTSSSEYRTVWSSPPKRPAGRTKFRETRHPVFRGVRRRGNAGRWVCEVRVPGCQGSRLWLGTFDTADAAARAHDAAMLALRCRAACLNFADSAWLLAVPSSFRSLGDVQRAAAEAVEDFLRREVLAEDALSATSTPSTGDDSAADASSPVTAYSSDDEFDSPFEFDVLSDMGSSLYYASLAQGLLMEPPATDTACGDDGECAIAEAPLWSYWS